MVGRFGCGGDLGDLKCTGARGEAVFFRRGVVQVGAPFRERHEIKRCSFSSLAADGATCANAGEIPGAADMVSHFLVACIAVENGRCRATGLQQSVDSI